MLNPQRLIADIDAVFLQFPDLAEDEELRAHVIEHGTDFKAAIRACLHALFEAEAMDMGLGELVAMFSLRRQRMVRKQLAMRALIQKIMAHAGASKFALAEATISIGNAPRSVIVTDESKLEERFIRTRREPDKQAIKNALLDGEVIEGAELSNGGTTLTVRTK